MQTTSSRYDELAAAPVRPVTARLLMSFDKVFDDNVDFFTVGTSTIGGTDVIKGDGDVVQEWDKYTYADYSDRLISAERTTQTDSPYSVTMSMLDITLNNDDNFFTPGAGSIIDDYILPQRPIKLYEGFGGDDLPIFIGLTNSMPERNENDKTVTFHCVDFLKSIMARPLSEEIIYQDMSTDDILSALFTNVGLTAPQLELDQGFNFIDFAYFEKDMKIGTAVNKLMQAELGRLFMDETGTIRFKNRQNYSATPVTTYDESNVVNFKTSQESEVINVVEITSKVREVQESQLIYKLSGTLEINASGTTELFFNFEDPVTTMETITNFTVNTENDGDGTNITSSVTVTDTDLFSKSVKVTFTNASVFKGFLRELSIYGTPAKVIREVYVREQDDDSVAKYEEQSEEIKNDFFVDAGTATSRAIILLNDFAEANEISEQTVVGNPALQIDDAVNLDNLRGFDGTYVVTKIVDKISPFKYEQRIKVKRRVFDSYFTIGISTIGGTDKIAP